MAELVIPNSYVPLPPQQALRDSPATVRGFGGAMGGGKSRALCEETFDWMLEHPGIVVPLFRQTHTSITLSTRRTFLEQVLPAELRGREDLVRIKNSSGEDFLELRWLRSQVHFVGLDNPGKWFSTEIGAAGFDEAHEISEKDVLIINSRLRQRCDRCTRAGLPECEHMPHRMIFTFNPSYPGHWLQQWFILGAQQTEHGYHKDELFATEADSPIGDSDFFVSKATDNPYLPEKYIRRTLAGFGKQERRRYMDGLWEHIGGGSFFDSEALAEQTMAAMEYRPYLLKAEPKGDPQGGHKADLERPDTRPAIVPHGSGRMTVFKPPVRWSVDRDGEEHKAHRYVVAVDASSGVSSDYSAVQVVDVEQFEQVAEFQGKCDPDKLAEVAFLTAAVYNGALLAPEITGGWGFAVVKRCQQMIGHWQGDQALRPQLYMRPIVDRLSQKFTDLLGWDTNTKSRAQMLDILEQSMRDGSLTIHGQRTLAEFMAFKIPERLGGVGDYRSPRASKDAHDDLVIALAIGVAVAAKLPKQLQRVERPEPVPAFSVTGY